MVSVLETMHVKAGEVEAFEREFEALARKVRAAEPGNLLYQLYAAPAEGHRYTALKIYRDTDDLEAHGASDYAAAAHVKLRALLAGPPERELLVCVV